jgi:hypothetical protein
MDDSVRISPEVIMSQQSTGLSDGERKPKRSRREHQMRMAAQLFDPESLMDMPLIAMFFGGKSLMTVSRWRNHPDVSRRFPPPDLYIGSIPYWKRGTVIAHRDRMVELTRLARDHANSADRASLAPSAPSPAAGGNPGKYIARPGRVIDGLPAAPYH